MPASLQDSRIYGTLFGDVELARLFTDSAEIRAMLIVEGALAEAQGAVGLIPETAARAIHRAAQDVQIDPEALTGETARSAVVVPALVSAFRAAMAAPEHAQFIHFGATSQDIIDTGLVLRLRKVLEILEGRLATLLDTLADLAERHAALPMAARTYAQVATPTTFGAVVAGWGTPLLAHRSGLATLRPHLLRVSLSGAAGTLSAMGEKGPEVRARMAAALALNDPGGTWHTDRSALAELAGWASRVAASLAKMGEDLILMTQTGIEEVALPQSGGSSTMPQKANPVLPSVLSALGRLAIALDGLLQSAAIQRQQRDGAAWFCEWLALPQLLIATGRALSAAGETVGGLAPAPDRMRAAIDDGSGLIYAEALSFALARRLPRPEAQAAVKELCIAAAATGTPLPVLAAERWPDHDLASVFAPETQLGQAPAEARAFAARVRLARG